MVHQMLPCGKNKHIHWRNQVLYSRTGTISTLTANCDTIFPLRNPSTAIPGTPRVTDRYLAKCNCIDCRCYKPGDEILVPTADFQMPGLKQTLDAAVKCVQDQAFELWVLIRQIYRVEYLSSKTVIEAGIAILKDPL